METRLICSGLGGQGVMMIGQLLGYAACTNKESYVTFYPSYGFEMRGGSANCYVVLSDEAIGAAKFSKTDHLIALSESALDEYLDCVVPGGHVYVNSSIIKREINRPDLNIHYVDAIRLAQNAGAKRSANLVMLGAFVEQSNALRPESIIEAMNLKFKKATESAKEANIQAFEAGRNS